MNERYITWQEVSVIVLGIALIPAIVMASGNVSDTMYPVGRVMVASIAPLMVLLIVWDYRRHHQSDLVPDVLGAQFGDSLLQLGDCQLKIFARQLGSTIELQCLVQNLFHSANAFLLTLQPHKNTGATAPVPSLSMTIPPSAVMSATLRLPLLSAVPPGQLIQWRVTASSTAGGRRQVRFARRPIVETYTPPAIKALMLLAGHHVSGGGTFVTVAPVPHTPDPSVPPPLPGSRGWKIEATWVPSHQLTAELAQRT